MHDIVRDFTLASHTKNELQRYQHQFVQALIDATDDVESKQIVVVLKYAEAQLSFHVAAAVTAPLRKNPAVITWLLHGSASGCEVAYQVERYSQSGILVTFLRCVLPGHARTPAK